MFLSTFRARLGVAHRLYCVAALTFGATVVLTAVSIHFALQTRFLAHAVETDGVANARLAVDTLVLLERHQRLMHTVVGPIGPDRLSAVRAELNEVEGRLELLERRLDVHLPLSGLLGCSRSILFAVEAGDAVLADTVLHESYLLYAEKLTNDVAGWRTHASATLDRELASLRHAAHVTVLWVLICLGAVALAALAGTFIQRRVVRRLQAITVAMGRLATGKTGMELPSLRDLDEVGDLARAAGVFQATNQEVLRRGEEIARTERQLQAALSNMTQGLCMYDAEHRLVVVNQRFFAITGFDPEVVRPGVTHRTILEHSFARGNYPGRTLEDVLSERGSFALRRESGSWLLEMQNGRVARIFHEPLPDGGWIMTFEDVTERRRAEEQIVFMARHDALTKLANRVLFHERIQQALAQTARGGGFALLCLDLDQFKAVNDGLGHPIGDRLLCEVGARLKGMARESDTVARLGGDEFAIVQHGVTQPRVAAAFAERMIEAVSRPYVIEGHRIVIGASIGIALSPTNGVDGDTLMRNADLALYAAKTGGRRTWRFFESVLNEEAQARCALERDLREALAREQLAVNYQPVIDAATRRICGFEALMRWQHPNSARSRPTGSSR